MVDYEVADEMKEIGKHCATISRGMFRVGDSGFKNVDGFIRGNSRGVVPYSHEDTATLTFISFHDRCYAVTAAHVIAAFAAMAERDGNPYEGYYLPAAPGVLFTGPFVRVPERCSGHTVDVAIRPFPLDKVRLIGKSPYVIKGDNDPSELPPVALAAGFPTAEKCDAHELQRMQMRGVTAVAEGIGGRLEADQLQFYSELLEGPSVKSLSGMSGGPVFWSIENRHGLLGFVKEATSSTAGNPEGLIPHPNSHFIVERATHDMLEKWFDFVDANWQQERNKLNQAIENQK